MDCLTAEQVEMLARDALSSTDAKPLRRHIAECGDCRERVDECLADERVLRKLKEPPGLGSSQQPQTAVRGAESATAVSPEGAAIPSRVDDPDARPRDLFPGYEVIRELGRGGQGVVFEALQAGTHRRVAVKVLKEGVYASVAARKRFEREIEFAAQLNHPNIVAIFHSGIAVDGQLFYVMDYVDGTPLHVYVHQSGLALEQLLAIYGKVCDAVEHAHRRGVIHRDLKPSNILVDREGEPKILDFGLARPLLQTEEQQLTIMHEVMGTLQYMAPEQARGDTSEVDTRTDVYALGVILYKLLTGQFPYVVEGTWLEVARHIVETPPAPPSQRWSSASGVKHRTARRFRSRTCPIDDELQTIVLKALAKERDRRYQSVVELARDIRHYLAGEAIEAKRDSALYVFRKLARRNLTATLTLSSVFVIAISAAFICFGFYRQASQALAQQVGSDIRLAARNREFDADGEAVKIAVQRMSLGWFLLEWQAGRLERAREILARTPEQLPEHAAMAFLLDPDMSPEQLLAQMPSGSAALAYFVAGERAYRAGHSSEAQSWFERCLSAGAGWIAESARARLAQLTAADAGAAQAGLE